MAYIKRVFYDLMSGEIILSYSQSGLTLNVMPLSHDFAVYPQLADRTEADTGCLEWQERDETVEDKLVSGEYIARVDVTRTPHVLVFEPILIEDDPELTDAETLAVLLGEDEQEELR